MPEADGGQEIGMTRTTVLGNARRRLPASIGASALALAVLAGAATPAAAAPSVKASVTDGTLRITGGPFADHIALRMSPLDRTQLQVDVGDDGSADRTFDLGTLGAIDVETRGGDDSVRIDEVNGVFTTTKATRIDGGNGDDTLSGGSGAELFIGGRGNDLVDGNAGADTAFLGKGDDVFVWDPGDGSDIVEGQSGSDTLTFNGSGGNEIMAASAIGGRVAFTRKLGNILMDLDGVEAIDVNALGGTDSVSVNDVSGTDLRRVDVDLAAGLGGSTGDGLADTVTVAGTKGDDSIAVDANGAAVDVSGLAARVRITHADPTSDTLIIDPVVGADTVAVDRAVNALILVSVL
jgi:Ca2+-binding RTX toxin-like protein